MWPWSSLIGDYESYIDKFYSVAEVLSDSNTDKDIAVKRQRYVQHPENLYFLLIEQNASARRSPGRAGGWQPVVLDQPEATLDLSRVRLHHTRCRPLSRHTIAAALRLQSRGSFARHQLLPMNDGSSSGVPSAGS